MATVSYAFFSLTVVGPSYDLHPGGTQQWEMWGGDFDYGDAIMVTAHPASRRRGRALAVEEVKILSDPTTPTKLSFVVRNVGTETVVGYGLGFAWMDK